MAINITSGGKPEEKLEWAFQMYVYFLIPYFAQITVHRFSLLFVIDRYDIDGNGTIERNEMVEIIRVYKT